MLNSETVAFQQDTSEQGYSLDPSSRVGSGVQTAHIHSHTYTHTHTHTYIYMPLGLVQQFRSSLDGDRKVGPSDAVAAIQALLQFIKDNKGKTASKIDRQGQANLVACLAPWQSCYCMWAGNSFLLFIATSSSFPTRFQEP